MKTIQKAFAFITATLSVSACFGQLGLGLGATTQSAVNATVNTASVVNTTQSVTATTVAATRSTMNVAATKTADLKATTSGTVQAGSKKTIQATDNLKKEVKGNADIKTGVTTNTSIQSSGNAGNGNTAVQGDLNAGVGSNGNVEINGSKSLDKTDKIATSVEGKTAEKTNATIQAAKTVKENTSATVKSDLQVTKESVQTVKPATNISASSKTETSTSITKQ